MEHKNHRTGLSDAQVIESRKKYGENILTPPEKEPLWKLFLEKFEDPIIRILLIAAFLSLGIAVVEHITKGVGHYSETVGIFCAIFLATGVAFWFERDANKKFELLNQVNDDDLVMVIRNNNVCQVSKREIVVGDTVLLEIGNEVPADGELVEAVNVQIDESCLTGEPSIDKTIDPNEFEEGVTYPSNYVLRGTKVINGHGTMCVVKVGDATEFGQVAEKSAEMVGGQTPLNRQLDSLAKLIGVLGMVLAALTFVVLFIKDIFFNASPNAPQYSLGQLGLVGAVIIGAVIALSKVWLPILYDAFELMGKDAKIPESVEKGGWFRWFGIGILTTLALSGVGLVFGVNPLEPTSWVSLDTAGHILQYFMVAVTLVVVAVPEGLPMSVTLSLALSMRRMLKANNLVRKMHACETMGATTVICTDKTGTLTQNQMQVSDTNFYALRDQKLGDDEIGKMIIEHISTNSTAFLDFSDASKVKALGNPTEGALLLWLNNNNINYLSEREGTKIIEQLPFSTERKYMATIVETNASAKSQKIMYIKGAPEIILGKCSIIQTENGAIPVSQLKEQIEEQLLNYQNQAMRTLGFAYKVADSSTSIDAQDEDFIFQGIAAISDPVRADVPDAVAGCIQAGINVKIVTGDTYATAREIGRQIGIWKDGEDSNLNIITGPDFEALSDEEALNRVKGLKIMCRARPSDKQRLVSLLKQSGEIVAVTGDGTNDAPALNHADVGLSMGSGTSVAKEASDITLLDDSFNSIAVAVMWGRSLYQNIQRFILFQLTINVAALLLVFLGSIFGHELPLTVTQMLWVNLIMDTFAAGALASLPPNPNVMNNKPRKNTDFIITPPMRNRILFVGLIFVTVLMAMLFYFSVQANLDTFFYYIDADHRNAYFLSYLFTVFVLLQFWNMFNAKAFQTGKSAFAGMTDSFAFIVVAGIILFGQLLIVTFGGDVFRTVPLLAKDWGIIIVATSSVLWFGELGRLFTKK